MSSLSATPRVTVGIVMRKEIQRFGATLFGNVEKRRRSLVVSIHLSQKRVGVVVVSSARHQPPSATDRAQRPDVKKRAPPLAYSDIAASCFLMVFAFDPSRYWMPTSVSTSSASDSSCCARTAKQRRTAKCSGRSRCASYRGSL